MSQPNKRQGRGRGKIKSDTEGDPTQGSSNNANPTIHWNELRAASGSHDGVLDETAHMEDYKNALTILTKAPFLVGLPGKDLRGRLKPLADECKTAGVEFVDVAMQAPVLLQLSGHKLREGVSNLADIPGISRKDVLLMLARVPTLLTLDASVLQSKLATLSAACKHTGTSLVESAVAAFGENPGSGLGYESGSRVPVEWPGAETEQGHWMRALQGAQQGLPQGLHQEMNQEMQQKLRSMPSATHRVSSSMAERGLIRSMRAMQSTQSTQLAIASSWPTDQPHSILSLEHMATGSTSATMAGGPSGGDAQRERWQHSGPRPHSALDPPYSGTGSGWGTAAPGSAATSQLLRSGWLRTPDEPGGDDAGGTLRGSKRRKSLTRTDGEAAAPAFWESGDAEDQSHTGFRSVCQQCCGTCAAVPTVTLLNIARCNG